MRPLARGTRGSSVPAMISVRCVRKRSHGRLLQPKPRSAASSSRSRSTGGRDEDACPPARTSRARRRHSGAELNRQNERGRHSDPQSGHTRQIGRFATPTVSAECRSVDSPSMRTICLLSLRGQRARAREADARSRSVARSRVRAKSKTDNAVFRSNSPRMTEAVTLRSAASASCSASMSRPTAASASSESAPCPSGTSAAAAAASAPF
jgi:hypothetical protein